MKKILKSLITCLLILCTLPMYAQVDCDLVITCIDADGISTDYSPCDETIDWNTLECIELLLDGEPLNVIIENDDFDFDYGYDYDCDFVITCIDADGISTDYDGCDENFDWFSLECTEVLIDGISLPNFDDYYGYDFDDDFDYYEYDFECDFVITCIDADGISTDYDFCDENLEFENLDCVEILIDGISLPDFDDYYGYGYDDYYDYDFEECDYEFECVDVDGNTITVNICDTLVDWNTLDCNFFFDYDDYYDYYDYEYDCDFVITCIDADGIATDYDPCDETVDFYSLECEELLIDGVSIQDFDDFDYDYYGWDFDNDFDFDFDFPNDSLWLGWECDTLFSIIIEDDNGNDPIVINPCDEDALIDLIENFDCIFDETIDCPWDTTGFYTWGEDGREFTPNSNASIVGLEELASNVNVTTVYPNPTMADFNVNVTVTEPTQVEVKVFSVTGQQISNKLFDVQYGSNQLDMTIENVPNGIYQVYLFEDSKMISNHKLSIVK